MVFNVQDNINPASSTTAKIMGKINTYKGIEVIPLDTNSNLNQLGSRSKPGLLVPPRMHRLPYISDHTLVPRVQKYLEANVDKTYIDINVMADELQKTYKEYSKRKRSAFRGSVKKAYSIVMHSYGHNEPQNSSSEELSEDSQGEEEVRYHDNSLNNQLLEMYGRNLQKSPVDANELIDISSDDSNDGSGGHKKSANGPSTSQKDDLTIMPQHLCEAELKEKSKIEQKLLGASTNVRGKKRKLESQAYISNKKKKNVANFEESLVTFKDVGGMDNVLEEVCKLLVHIKHPEIYRQIGISPPRGFLLHGPPGCGKTLLANAIAGELEIPLLKVSAPELVAGVSGESEERIRELFEKAMLSAPCVLFIDEIDAITPNRQNAQKEMERRIVAQLLTCLDDLNKSELCDQVLVIGATNRPDSLDPALRRAGRFDREVCLGIPDIKSRLHILKVLTAKLKLSDSCDFETIAKYTPGFVGADLLAATREAAMAAVNRVFNELKEKNHLNKILALQKKQEEDNKEKEEKEIVVTDDKNEVDIVDVEGNGKPEEEKTGNVNMNSSDTAVVIIDDDVKDKSNAHVNNLPSSENVKNIEDFKPKTILEDLVSWLHGDVPLKGDQLTSLCITMEDFGIALKNVQPSAKREGFATVPDTTWNDVGSLRDIRQELQMAILAPVRHAEQFKALGLTTPAGVLLCGPPGCGKTLLAKAIANEAGINFLSVKGPELLNMYVGESERAVRVCFERARNSAPCVIFFDELDALCPKRSDCGEGGASMRVVNQMLTEMDGVEGREGVFLLAASNRPDIIDPAVLRPGRLDKILYVGLPSPGDRVDILRTITKDGKRPLLAPDVDLEIIGKSDECEGYTGADLAALVREAGVEALKEYMLLGDPQKTLMVCTEHFKRAVVKVRPSVPEKDQKHYEKLKKQYAAKSPDNDVEEMEYP